MNNWNVSSIRSIFASTKDYTTVSIITLKINGMKDLPNLTQCQENLYSIYRFQMERSSIRSTKHLYSFFLPSPLHFLLEPKLSAGLIGRNLLVHKDDTVITKQKTLRVVHSPSLKPGLSADSSCVYCFACFVLFSLKELSCY